MDQEYERIHQDARGEALEALMAERPCPACARGAAQPAARAVTFAGLRLPELARMPLAQALAWFQPGPAGGRPAARPRPASCRRLRGPGPAPAWATWPRTGRWPPSPAARPSGSRLAAALGEGLAGVAYVLDEPTRGLHPRDTARLGSLLRALADAGNAVVVVEHDPGLVARADQVMELGPGAGPGGRPPVAAGAPAQLLARGDSHTGRLLAPRTLAGPRRPGRPASRCGAPACTTCGTWT